MDKTRAASYKLTQPLPTSPQPKGQPWEGGLGLEVLPRVARQVGLGLCGEGAQGPLLPRPLPSHCGTCLQGGDTKDLAGCT